MSDFKIKQSKVKANDESKSERRQNKRSINLKGKQLKKKISCNKLCYKIFLEDVAKINSINNNYNQELTFDDIFDETIKMLFKVEYNNIYNFQKIQSELYSKYLKIKLYNKSFYSLMVDLESTSEIDRNDPSKTIKRVVLKDINGNYIRNYLEKMNNDNYQYINSFNIENNRKYNLFFEMISSKDALSIKIIQILKYIIFLNFLYDTNKIFQNLSKQNKPKKEEEKDKNTVNNDDNGKTSKGYKKLTELKQFFNNKYKFIDLTKKTLIFIVSNGQRKDFESIIASLKNQQQSNLLEELKTECSNKHNLYFKYSSFDQEKFIEEIINEIYNKKEGDVNQIGKDDGDKININDLIDRIKKLEDASKKKG